MHPDPRFFRHRFVPYRQDYPVVWVETNAFDRLWRLDITVYLSPEEWRTGWRVERIFNDPTELMRVPLAWVELDHPSPVGFRDGRHRFALMRNVGMNPIPVSLLSRSCLEAR